MQQKEKTAKDSVYCDYNIFPGKVRLVTETGSEVLERDEAIEKAKAQNANLIQISYNRNEYPRAICKIMDYGKFLYEQKKKAKQAQKQIRESSSDIKEIVFSIRIETADYETKLRHIKEFLSAGDKVKLTIKLLRGEVRSGTPIAKDMLNSLLEKLKDISVLDSKISESDFMYSCIIRPVKQ